MRSILIGMFVAAGFTSQRSSLSLCRPPENGANDHHPSRLITEHPPDSGILLRRIWANENRQLTCASTRRAAFSGGML